LHHAFVMDPNFIIYFLGFQMEVPILAKYLSLNNLYLKTRGKNGSGTSRNLFSIFVVTCNVGGF
jgi:hypothetical protein